MTTQRVPERDRILFGLPLQALLMDEVVELCTEAIATRKRSLIGVVNAAKVVAMRRDEGLRDSLLECDLIVADGQAVVWASRLLRQPLPERVTGIDLFERLLEVADRDHLSIYLLGATPEILSMLESRIHSQYPGLQIGGSRDGYFSSDEEADIAAEIRSSGADMLFLGMGSPQKENFLRDWGHSLQVPLMHGVGGSFDVFAGVTKRAPRWMQRSGLEWAYRLEQEPARMWRRYLTGNVTFILLTLAEVVSPRPLYQTSTRTAAVDNGDGREGRAS